MSLCAPADQTSTASASRLLSACPLCQSPRLHYAFSRGTARVVRCADCRLMLLNPPPSPVGRLTLSARVLACDAVDETLRRYSGDMGTTLRALRMECAEHASHCGCQGVSNCAHAGDDSSDTTASSARACDICDIGDLLERTDDPLRVLGEVRDRLKPDGILRLSIRSSVRDRNGPTSQRASEAKEWAPRLGTPSRGRGSNVEAGLPKPAPTTAWGTKPWHPATRSQLEAREGNATVSSGASDCEDLPALAISFDALTIQNALFLGGFNRVLLAPSPDGATTVLARRAAMPPRRRLSIIIPAFNEAATFEQLLGAVLTKRLPELDIEVVIVESNSTDGTRQIAMQYAEHPSVRLILEDRPQGKGHAVRTGLAAATGDFILIQDADLEYDLEDYDVLLDPLVKGREALVLGSRHGGHAWWKMRTFADQPLLSLVFNCGHWFFTTALNRLFGQRLKDPFTMFKVFRRDCLYGLEFQCNRFDFDYELLIKMIRKGYRPIEIPVNYRSRSYGEGKKVSAFRDPFNWMKALVWLRFTRIDPLSVVEAQNGKRQESNVPEQQHAMHKAA